METLAFGAIAIGILLYIIRPFEWKNFGKSLGVPSSLKGRHGANVFQEFLLALAKIGGALLCGLFQFFKFCAKCAWKMSPGIGGKKSK